MLESIPSVLTISPFGSASVMAERYRFLGVCCICLFFFLVPLPIMNEGEEGDREGGTWVFPVCANYMVKTSVNRRRT